MSNSFIEATLGPMFAIRIRLVPWDQIWSLIMLHFSVIMSINKASGILAPLVGRFALNSMLRPLMANSNAGSIMIYGSVEMSCISGAQSCLFGPSQQQHD